MEAGIGKMTYPWVVRGYRTGDERGIADLLDAAFPSRKWRSLEYWRWKYMKNPAGSPVICLAECDERIIGHYAITPMRMKLGNLEIMGSCSCDAATDPKYQGQGVFSSIVNRAYLEAARKGFAVTYGFSSTHLGPTYKRYEHKGQICSMVRTINVFDWKPLLTRHVGHNFLAKAVAAVLQKSRRPRPLGDGLAIERNKRFDERADAFWEKVSHHFRMIVRRDQRYLNWRYVDHPEEDYTIFTAVEDDIILGYCVLSQERWDDVNVGLIVDLLGLQDDRNVVGGLIDRALDYFEEQSVDAATSLLSEQHPYMPFFRRVGFITYPRHRLALHVSVNVAGSPMDEKGVYSQALLLSQNRFLKEKGNWFMMYGDGDQA
jgi:GNAT superfamily N-acetyltransferase